MNSLKTKFGIGLAVLLLSHPVMAAKAKSKDTKSHSGNMVTISTTKGNIEIKLYPQESPETVKNFLGLASGEKEWTDPKSMKKVKGKSLYQGTIFHRVIPKFMIQGGDPLGTGTGGPGYKFADEHNGLKFDRPGLLAMANAGPNTNGSQFFITVVPTPWLNGRHTIFGEVVKGMDVVNKIVTAETVRGTDRPKNEIKIKSVKIK